MAFQFKQLQKKEEEEEGERKRTKHSHMGSMACESEKGVSSFTQFENNHMLFTRLY